MQTITIDLIVPTGWHELTDKQLRYVYLLFSQDYSEDEVKTLCLLRWTGTKVLALQESGSYLLKKGKTIFEVTLMDFVSLILHLEWLGSLPTFPVRPSTLRHRPAIAADFSEVPFEQFIIVDNLYQGYLQTQDDNLLDEIATVVYPGIKTPLTTEDRIAIFYWIASLKDYFARRYHHFLQPLQAATGGNLLGTPSVSVEEAMNAQIRALTKGDVTKEAEVLALDTHRALTELNAQAYEYQELLAKSNTK